MRPLRLSRAPRPWSGLVLLVTALLAPPLPGPHGMPPAAAAEFAYQWAHPRPQGNPVNAIAFADQQHGWGVGASGFVLRTADAGVSWQLQQGPLAVAPDLYDLVVTPGGALLACGSGQGLYRSTDGGAHRTVDGGATWQLFNGAGLAAAVRAMVWFDSSVGVAAVGFPGSGLHRTHDGGLN